MTPDRLRAVLRSLRWSPRILATALSISEDLVEAWLDGTGRIPDNVAEWLEALAVPHEARPLPEGWDERRPGRAAAARVVFARKPSRRW
jgi:hypothetical protein